jgi:hypothetical protein
MTNPADIPGCLGKSRPPKEHKLYPHPNRPGVHPGYFVEKISLHALERFWYFLGLAAMALPRGGTMRSGRAVTFFDI